MLHYRVPFAVLKQYSFLGLCMCVGTWVGVGVRSSKKCGLEAYSKLHTKAIKNSTVVHMQGVDV